MDQSEAEKQKKLAAFREINVEKIPWPERVKLIHEHFPSVKRLDWKQAFRADPALMGRIINDILKVDAAEPGKPGKRPSLEQGDAARRYTRLAGEDYSVESFAKAFAVLKGERSIRHTASKVGLNYNRIFKLMNGTTPTEHEMEQIANAFEVRPDFFAEYRLAHIVGFLYSRLAENPEATVVFFRKIQDRVADGRS